MLARRQGDAVVRFVESLRGARWQMMASFDRGRGAGFDDPGEMRRSLAAPWRYESASRNASDWTPTVKPLFVIHHFEFWGPIFLIAAAYRTAGVAP